MCGITGALAAFYHDSLDVNNPRTGVETRNTQAVLDGSLDQFIEASLKAGL
jgi:peptide chain release factor 2